MRRALAFAVVLLAAAPAPATAHVAGREGAALVVRADPGQANDVDLTLLNDGRLSVYDRAPGLAAGEGCTPGDYPGIAECSLDGVAEIVIETGDGDDLVDVDSRLLVPSRVDGGPGADNLIGGAGPDRLTGGPGADNLSGGEGDDDLDGADGEADELECGPGDDAARGEPDLPVLAGDKVDACERAELRLPGGEISAVGGVEGRRGRVIELDAAPGTASRLQVTLRDGGYDFTDPGGIVPVGDACTRPDPADRTRVRCPFEPLAFVLGDGDDAFAAAAAPGAPGRRAIVRVAGEAGDDRLGVAGLGAALDGGEGNDELTGGDLGDLIRGGRGDDVIRPGGAVDFVDVADPRFERASAAAGGRDRIDLRDGAPDEYGCDRADRGVLDGDVMDEGSVACERWLRIGDTSPRAARSIRVNARGRLRVRYPRRGTSYAVLPVTCPKGAAGGCSGGVMLAGSSEPFGFSLAPGESARLRPRLGDGGERTRVIAVTRDGAGRTRTERVRVRLRLKWISF